MSPPSNKAALAKLTTVAQHYRDAYRAVQSELGTPALQSVSPWVFALDRLTMEEVHSLSADLGHLEQERRAWRCALHAIAEHVALEDLDERAQPLSCESEDGESQADKKNNQEQLDRLISVLHRARAGDCIYVNGTFQPVRSTSFRGSGGRQVSRAREEVPPLDP